MSHEKPSEKAVFSVQRVAELVRDIDECSEAESEELMSAIAGAAWPTAHALNQ